MPFHYQSGEEIKARDRVLIHGEAGQIEFVAEVASDPEDWYVKTFGGGVMVIEPKCFGSLFIAAPVSEDEDLEFLSRESDLPAQNSE